MADNVRMPVVAGQFYEGRASALRRAVADCAGGYAPPEDLGEVLGGVAPHAGWVFSGPTAAKVFLAIARKTEPQTFVVFGAVHRYLSGHAAIYPGGAWQTPLGRIDIDADAAEAAAAECAELTVLSAEAHEGEHSIEVQVPFIQALCPDAKLLAIAVPPMRNAADVGRCVARALAGTDRRSVVVASTDLTHYGMGYGSPDQGTLSRAMPWMRENDRRMIRLVEELKADEVVAEAQANRNACGAGAVAAAVAAAKALGAAGARTLEYTTSADVMPEPNADRAVGYVGIVFEKHAG